jgi:hypothetical protein
LTATNSDRVLHALIFGDHSQPGYLAYRTARSARAAGWQARDVTQCSAGCLAEILGLIGGPVWLLRAGAWCPVGWPLAAFSPKVDSEQTGEIPRVVRKKRTTLGCAA